MDTNQFLEALRERIGGKVISEDGMGNLRDTGRSLFKRLYADYQKHYIKVDFIDHGLVLFEVNMGTPHHLLLRPENVVSKLLDSMHLSPEVKIGDPAFDARYIIQNLTEEQAKKTINEAFRDQIKKLEPFMEFEMTGREYKLSKVVDIEGPYTVDSAVADLDALIALVDVIKKK